MVRSRFYLVLFLCDLHYTLRYFLGHDLQFKSNRFYQHRSYLSNLKLPTNLTLNLLHLSYDSRDFPRFATRIIEGKCSQFHSTATQQFPTRG